MANILVWTICVAATAGVILRPLRVPEAVWAVAGAALLVAGGLVPVRHALGAIQEGTDVYLFLAGMMLLSEIARREGLFDWLAIFAVNAAKGSPARLFTLVYAVGTLVTIFLSNDATAVVLTPAVFAAARKARVTPLPYLFVCALVANAASFVLPISNPANLVLYGRGIPALWPWLLRFTLPSLAAIFVTYAALRLVERDALGGVCARDLAAPKLSRGGRVALVGIVLAVAVLLGASAAGRPLGLPTAVLGAATLLVSMAVERRSAWPLLAEISWSILPLVAGLFVMVEAMAQSGIIATLAVALHDFARTSEAAAAAASGAAIAFGCNLANNLPAGLIARATLANAHASTRIADSVLIGVDLGPNLSVTGSLATILWLGAIRREGLDVSFWRFLKAGALVMPPALLLALAARLLL